MVLVLADFMLKLVSPNDEDISALNSRRLLIDDELEPAIPLPPVSNTDFVT